jgi:hypothetical protein
VEFYYYVNIFETKGLEYLLLLSFLVLFILLVRYLTVPAKKEPGPAEGDPTAGR